MQGRLKSQDGYHRYERREVESHAHIPLLTTATSSVAGGSSFDPEPCGADFSEAKAAGTCILLCHGLKGRPETGEGGPRRAFVA